MSILVALCGPIAQLVEPPAHNRMVRGSNPLGPTTFLWRLICCLFTKITT